MSATEDRIVQKIKANFKKYAANFSDQLVLNFHMADVVPQAFNGSPRLYEASSKLGFVKQLGRKEGKKNGDPLQNPPYFFYPCYPPSELTTLFSPNNSPEVFNRFNNAQVASLTPLIELFLYNQRTAKYFPIPLQNIHNEISILSNVNRLYGFLGVKEIVIDLKGDSFETRKKDIDIAITYYGNNLSVFDVNEKDYLPLIHPFYQNKGSSYELYLRTGWNDPTPTTQELLFSGNGDAGKVAAIKAQKLLYKLQYTKHSFAFNEDGSFILEVNYASSIEENLEDINYVENTSADIKEMYPIVGNPQPLPVQQQSQISDFISENHAGASDAEKERIYNYFAQDPKTVSKKIKDKRSSTADRNKKFLYDMLYVIRKNKCAYTCIAKKSYLRAEMFRRALNTVSWSDPAPKPQQTQGSNQSSDYIDKERLRMVMAQETGLIKPRTVTRDGDGNVTAQSTEKKYYQEDAIIKTVNQETAELDRTFRGTIPTNGNDLELTISRYPNSTDGNGIPVEATNYTRENHLANLDPGYKLPHFIHANSAYPNPVVHHIFEFYRLGDILNAFLATCPSTNTLREVEIVLGPINITPDSLCGYYFNSNAGDVNKDPETNGITDLREKTNLGNPKSDTRKNPLVALNAAASDLNNSISLYDIPISYQMLQRVVVETFAKSTMSRLTYFEFFNALMNLVVRPFYLQGDPVLTNVNHKGVVKTYQKVLSTSAKYDGFFSMSHLKKQFNPINLKDPGDTKAIHITMCGPATTSTKQKIDTYRVGSAGSLIKKVQFQQTNLGVQRARSQDNAAAAYRDGNSEIVPQLYNVTMDLVGNLNFYPGYVFDLRPTIVGMGEKNQDQIFKTLGIHGRYFTTAVVHNIGLSGFTTKITKAYNFAKGDPAGT